MNVSANVVKAQLEVFARELEGRKKAVVVVGPKVSRVYHCRTMITFHGTDDPQASAKNHTLIKEFLASYIKVRNFAEEDKKKETPKKLLTKRNR